MNLLLYAVIDTLLLMQTNIETALTGGLGLLQTSTIAFINDIKSQVSSILSSLAGTMEQTVKGTYGPPLNTTTSAAPLVLNNWTRIIHVVPGSDYPFVEVLLSFNLPTSAVPFALTNISGYVFVGNSSDVPAGATTSTSAMGVRTARIFPRDTNAAPAGIYPQASAAPTAMASFSPFQRHSPSTIQKKFDLHNVLIGNKGLSVWIYQASASLSLTSASVKYRGATLINQP